MCATQREQGTAVSKVATIVYSMYWIAVRGEIV